MVLLFSSYSHKSTINAALTKQSEHNYASDDEGDTYQTCIVDFLVEEKNRNKSDGRNADARPNCVHDADWNAFEGQ